LGELLCCELGEGSGAVSHRKNVAYSWRAVNSLATTQPELSLPPASSVALYRASTGALTANISSQTATVIAATRRTVRYRAVLTA